MTGGGTAGNEELTALTGAILFVLLAVLGITILQVRQLIWLHLFLGLLLIGPVLLKMASTGYRFVRYYAGDRSYRLKGPPAMELRLLGPLVVLTTVVVFASGVVLLFVGPDHRGPLVSIHKVSFFLWLGVTALHVLGHLPHMSTSLRAVHLEHPDLPRSESGGAARWIGIAGALVAGVVLAVVLIPHFGAWTAPGAFPHHHH